MSTKSRGSNAERDLIHMFWAVGWASMRSAGSGSAKHPSPDIVAGNNLRRLAIEAKLTTKGSQYFMDQEIHELKLFAENFGAEPWVAVKFFRKPWFFITLEDIESSGKHFVVTKELAERRGFSFEELVKM